MSTTQTDTIEPSIILYWKKTKKAPKGEFLKVNKIFTSKQEINRWYAKNRWRVDGISIVEKLNPSGKQQKLFKE